MGNYWSGNVVERYGAATYSILRTAVRLAVAGAAAGGVIAAFGIARPQPASNANLNDSHIAANIYAQEIRTGCVDAGTNTGCLMVLVGVTNNGHVFTKSGGLIVGPLGSPKFAASGALVKIGGGYPDSTNALEVVGTTSGTTVIARTASAATVTISGKYSATTIRLSCYKAGGVLGYIDRTATGTLLGTCN